ncbi:MAG TPA: hypothetical protein VI260_31710 [Blastocatellia bacterium]|jgi:hypothetical protein
MREDMSKVVIERPRWGHGLPSRKTRLRIRRYDPDKEYDDLPSRVSGSRSKYIRSREIKDFSDLIGPLRRFLRKNVGRPWNLVYSEMKEILDDRTVTGRHVFEHVEWEVETHALIGDDGELYKLEYGRRYQPIYEFYVDPRTGLLCWSDNESSERRLRKLRKLERDAPEVNRVLLSINTCYAKLNGIWYFIEFKNYKNEDDRDQANQPLRSILIPEISSASLLLLRKKQLSHKELKTAKLKNDHPLAVKDEVNHR